MTEVAEIRAPLAHSRPALIATSGTAAAGSWRPTVRVGAPAVGGLSLPAAHPTAAHLYAPRGVWFDDDVLVVADSGNHRILIWHGLPSSDEAEADVILCQPAPTAEGPAAGGRGPSKGVHLPTGVLVHDGALFVADAWHHRILVWSTLPTAHDAPPDGVIGQTDLQSVQPNRGEDSCGPDSMYWPYGLGLVGGVFWVADTGNRRVLGWSGGPPEPGSTRGPDILLGQAAWTARDENRGGDPTADSFRWPHDIAGTDHLLLVADAGNHRVLGWAPVPDGDGPADLVLGQDAMTTATEWPYGPQRAIGHRFPYAISVDGDRLVVADTANNRLLVWDSVPRHTQQAPDHVLAQPDFAANGENRWDQVRDDTLCWPYGVHLRGDRLAVADSGNNRVMVWESLP
nr:NHL repeat-containing protein [Euzebya rosea]